MIYVICTLLGAALLGLDQWVKHWTVAHLALEETASLLPGFVELHRVHNYGAAWSSFSGQRWLLVGVTGLILLAIVALLVKRLIHHPLGIVACYLVLVGGLGNIVDRIRAGYVVDMFHFQFWPSYPVFNVADMCVVCGCILGAIYYLWLCEKEPKETADGTTDAPSE